MRRAVGHGFWLSLIINMLFRAGWLGLVAILIILHFILSWPLWLIIIPLAFWVLHALIITLVLKFANSASGAEPVRQDNKNPYSAKNDNYYK